MLVLKQQAGAIEGGELGEAIVMIALQAPVGRNGCERMQRSTSTSSHDENRRIECAGEMILLITHALVLHHDNKCCHHLKCTTEYVKGTCKYQRFI